MRVSRRTTATVSVAVISAGLGVVLWGVWENDPARAAGGACLTITSLTAVALVVLRGWITDTSAERTRLATAGKLAEDERARYIASQAALAVERDRMRRDTEYATTRAVAQLEAERRKLQRQFDEERNALVCETFEAAFEMLKGGLPAEVVARGRSVIQFPTQHPAGAGERARGRDVRR